MIPMTKQSDRVRPDTRRRINGKPRVFWACPDFEGFWYGKRSHETKEEEEVTKLIYKPELMLNWDNNEWEICFPLKSKNKKVARKRALEIIALMNAIQKKKTLHKKSHE